jgi:hypothetical protein
MYKGTEHQPKGASVVYWIHKPEHTDITKQGYVGITHNLAMNRWRDHQSASKYNPDVHCAVVNRSIRKHPDLIYEVVLVADTREYCECIEGLLRPTNRIGWNIARGGMPVDTMMGGIANKQRWIQHWIDNPVEAANRWWNAERRLLKKQKAQRKANAYMPHGNERKLSANNSSGHTGCSFYKPFQKWRVQICVNGDKKFLGYYDCLEQAIKVYTKAKQESKALRMENKKKKLFHQRIA